MIDIYKEAWEVNVCMVGQYLQSPLCDICGEKMRPYCFVPSFLLGTDKPVLLYQCPDCKFISRDFSAVTDTKLRDGYIDLVMPGRKFDIELKSQENYDGYKDLCLIKPRPSVVVDMGSGVGGLEYFSTQSETKIKVISFDVCKELIDYAATQKITIHSVDITSEKEIRDKLEFLGYSEIDCIYSSNTLEHLLNPSKVLAMWSRLMKRGCLYIVIPSMDCIFNERWTYQNLHFSYFTEETFRKLADKIGLKVIASKRFNEHNQAGTGSMKFVMQRND